MKRFTLSARKTGVTGLMKFLFERVLARVRLTTITIDHDV